MTLKIVNVETLRKSNRISIVCIASVVLGMIFQAVYYSTDLAYTHPEYIFADLAFVTIPALYVIFFCPSRKSLISLLILTIAVFMNLTYWYYSRDLPYIPPLDAIYHFKTAKEIIVTSHLQPTEDPFSIEFAYSRYPGYHLFISTMSVVTGVDAATLVKISPLVYTILPFLMYSLSKLIFGSERIAWIASFVVIFLPKWYPFPSYDRIVFIYVFMLFIFLLKLTISPTRKLLLAALISMFSISITHHITNYVTLGSLVFILILMFFTGGRIGKRLPLLKNAKKSKLTFKAVMCLIVIGLLFPFYLIYDLTGIHLLDIMKYLSPSYKAPEFTTSVLVGFSGYETIVILGTVFIFGVLGVIGFLSYLRSSKWNVTAVALVVFIGLLFSISLPFMNVNSSIALYVRYRGVFVVFMMISPFIGYSLVRIFEKSRNRKRLLGLAIILSLFALAISSARLMPASYFFLSSEQSSGALWEVRNYSHAMFASLEWYARNTLQNSKAIGDVPIHDIGNGMLDLNVEYQWSFYEADQISRENISSLTYTEGVRYVFLDRLMTAYTEQYSFSMFKEPISGSHLTNLTNNPWLDRAYDDEIVSNLFIYPNP